jgi:hypothetical protein
VVGGNKPDDHFEESAPFSDLAAAGRWMLTLAVTVSCALAVDGASEAAADQTAATRKRG